MLDWDTHNTLTHGATSFLCFLPYCSPPCHSPTLLRQGEPARPVPRPLQCRSVILSLGSNKIYITIYYYGLAPTVVAPLVNLTLPCDGTTTHNQTMRIILWMMWCKRWCMYWEEEVVWPGLVWSGLSVESFCRYDLMPSQTVSIGRDTIPWKPASTCRVKWKWTGEHLKDLFAEDLCTEWNQQQGDQWGSGRGNNIHQHTSGITIQRWIQVISITIALTGWWHPCSNWAGTQT